MGADQKVEQDSCNQSGNTSGGQTLLDGTLTGSGVALGCARGKGYGMVVLNVLVLMAALGVVFAGHTERGGGMGDSVTPVGITSAFSDTDIAAWADEVFAPQLAALGCDTEKRLAPRVAVRHAQRMRDGHFDSGVLRVVSFDEAWRLTHNDTTTDDVEVKGWCGR